jgi:flagellar P-ring protein precursor FlgI
MKQRFRIIALLLTFLLVPAFSEAGTRLKDLASVEGVRENQVVGYGLVVGLNETRRRREVGIVQL